MGRRAEPMDIPDEPTKRSPLLLLGVGSGVVIAVLLAALLGFFVWKRSDDKRIEMEKQEESVREAAAEKERRKLKLEQRKVYEKWNAANLRIKFFQSQIENEKKVDYRKPDPVKISKLGVQLAEQELLKNDAEIEALKRWGKHPSDFEMFPGSLNMYYRDQ